MIRLIRTFTVSLGAIASLSTLVQAQTIIPAADGTATLVMPNGNTFNITGGTLSGDGRNLFHSFQEFGLSTQQIANFIANPTIQNILGRVVGGNPSLINGLIQVSGGQANLFLMNPSGMVFGPNASINVPASFAATTATGIGFGNGQFNAYGTNDYQSLLGNPQTFVFQGIQPGAIINAGDLTVPEGQGISLVAGTVVNTGNISAPAGEITLAAVPGTSLVRISQVGQVLSLEVPLPTDAQGNAVPFNATDLPGLLTGSRLETGLTVTPQGTVQVTATGTQIPTTPGTNIVAGQLTTATDRAAGLGGTIQITGTQVGLVGANLDASGTQGGGKILVGGEYQGKGNLPTAQNTYVSGDSVLKANAINQGDGGEVIVWADGNTAFAGNIEAQGGSQGGDGGFVEVSGKENLTFQGQVNLQAPQGDLGTLLLDPENITVTSGIGLNDRQLPVILFDQGAGFDYTISQTALEALSGNTNIILEAANNITIEPLLGGVLRFQPGTGSIRFVADANNGGRGDFSMDTTNTILAPGRNISIQGINLTVGQIVTSNFANAGLGNSLASVGGSVNLTATGGITTGVVETGGGNFNATGTNLNVAAVDTSTGTEGLDGGAIALTATGNIQTGNLLSYTIANRPDGASQGGDITLNAGGSIDTTVGTGVEVAQTSTETLFVPVIASGSETGNGGDINLTAGGNIKTAFLGSGSLNNGRGGDVNLTSTNGSIDATQTVTLNGESQILGAIATASRAGQGGNVTITAPGNIQTGSIITGNIDGVNPAGNVTITSTQGSINTAIGANISPVSAELLSELGVDAQYLAEASQIGVDLGIFTVSKNVNGGNASLTAANDIITSNIITGSLNGTGGNISLTSNSGSIDTSAAVLFENLTASFLQSLGASENLAQLGAYLSDNQIGGLITFSVFGNGGNISLTAPGNITNNYLIANSYTQRGGNVSLNSRNGNIRIGGLLTNINPLTFGVASDGLTLTEWTAIGDLLSQGSLTTAGADGGNISLLATEGDIEAVTVNAQGGDNGRGGNVDIRAGENVHVTGTFVDQNGVIASISTAGGIGGGDITIQSGNTPFIVGDASLNGTAGAITSGEFTILPDENFDFTTERGNIALILQDPPPPIPPIPPVDPPIDPPSGTDVVCQDCAQFNSAFQPQRLPPPLYALNTQNLAVKTLGQAEDILAEIEAKTGKKPALIYVNFTVPDIKPPEFADAQFNQVESALVSEYQTLITPKLTKALPTLAIPPKQDYQLELVVISQGQDPYRIAVPQATRRDVLLATNRLLNLISKQQDDYLPFASELYQWLIAPIEPTLKARKIDSTLFFLPDGLRTLPLAALYDQSEQKFVVQKDFSVGTAPSLNLVDYRYRNLNNAPVLAFGATEFPEQNQTPLPGVGIELPLIQSIKGGDVFLNQDFNLSNLTTQRQVNPLPIVHLATHADFLEVAPQKSYIQFYNQKLELPKWNQLDLNLPATDLLVISACNTAVGNSAVELGFGGMAVQAGVKTSLASLWPVGDIGTVGLMDSFYRNLKTVPIKSDALQFAQRALLSGEYRWVDNQLITPEGPIEFPELDAQTIGEIDLSHPYFWAAFMMIGSPW